MIMSEMELREKIQQATEQLPDRHLSDVLRWIELLVETQDNENVEPEEMWLLATGYLKKLVDSIEDAPAPVDDWRSALDEL